MAAKGLSILFFFLAYCLYKPPDESQTEVHTRESQKRQMAFVNGSFRDSEFEHTVQNTEVYPNTENSDKTTDLWNQNIVEKKPINISKW